MKRISNIFALTVLSAFIYADEEATEQSFPGLVSSEILIWVMVWICMLKEEKHVAKVQLQNIFILLQVQFMF